jgi:translation initiation factor 1
MSDSRLVYSSDPNLNKKCPKCKELVPECRCAKTPAVPKRDFTAVLRIEKNGRGGKIVTVIDKLPRSEKFLSELARTLKARCGSGGTYLVENGAGVIEIQGDKRERIRTILAKEGIPSKG